MMDLVDRYLHAIERQLPPRHAADIAAELRDDLQSRIEEREAALGRTLTKDETAELIKHFGHPLLVAARYRRHQWLIGPDVFPFYLFVLRIILLAVAVVLVVAAAAAVVFAAASPLSAALNALGQLFMYALINGAIVTLIFALLERTGFPADHIRKWRPDQLPDVREERPGRWESPIEVALTIAFLLWWTGLVGLPLPAGGSGFRIEAAPVWGQLYWPILVLAAARLVHNVVQWLRPRWRALRLALGAATAVGALALLPFIYGAGEWMTVVSTGLNPAGVEGLQASLNLALRIAIIAVGIIWMLNCLGELWRLGRAARAGFALA
jgi:hypothetical protein